MNKIKCCIVQDLLPLYIDNVLSEGSSQEVHRHLEECENCRQEYRTMLKDVVLPTNQEVQEENSQVLKRFKSKWIIKKFLISFFSAVLAVCLFFPIRDVVMESEFFAPVTRARAGTVGQLSLGELSNGEWTRMYFIKENLFNNTTSYWEPYLIFDNPFYKKHAINSGISATSVEMRIMDVDGNIVIGPFSVDPGYSVPLEELDFWTEYIVEWRAEGDFYMFTFD